MDKENVVCVLYTHTHTQEYNLAIKKNEILPSATTWMDLEGIMLSEISQRQTNTVYDLTHTQNLKKTKQNQQPKNQAHRYPEQIGGCQR